jgi:hypothetical protein
MWAVGEQKGGNVSEDVLMRDKHLIADALKSLADPARGRMREWSEHNLAACVAGLAAEVLALREERDEIKRKAIEQSEYIQSRGLTEYEMARLKARVAELEAALEAAQKEA